MDPNKNGGGLCFIWDREIQVTILVKNKYMIHATIEHCIFPCKWYLTRAYGPPTHKDKNNFWSLLENTADCMGDPWIIIGDLNEILLADDKLGGRTIGSSSRNYLHNFLTNTDFTDLGFRGSPFTWSNNRYGPNQC